MSHSAQKEMQEAGKDAGAPGGVTGKAGTGASAPGGGMGKAGRDAGAPGVGAKWVSPLLTLGRRLAWLPIVVSLATMAVVYLAGFPVAYPHPRGLLALNFVFLTLSSFFIAFLLARSFLDSGTLTLLFLGSGVVIWGAASSTALAGKSNLNALVTVLIVGAFLSGACHLLGALRYGRARPAVRAPGLWLPVVYGAALSSVALLSAMAWEGLLPEFLNGANRGTRVCNVVSLCSIGMFAISGVLLRTRGKRVPSSFVHWYSFALMLLAVGLFGVSRSRADTLLSWTGRASLYAGGLYMLVAALASVRETGVLNVPLGTALQESEERFKALAAATFEGIVVIEDGKFTDANDQFLEMVGYSREELIGMEVTATLLPEDRERVLENIRQGHETRVELEVLCKGGRRIVAELHGRTSQYEGRKVRFTAVRDVTDRKLVQAKLEEAKRTLDALMEYVPEGITIADGPEGTIRVVSRYGKALLGGDHQGATLASVVAEWKVFQSDGVTPLAVEDLPLSRALQKGETVRDAELVQVNAEGKALWLACNAAPIRDSSGGIAGSIVAWRDITVRKKMEEALRLSETRYRSLFDGMTEGFAIHEIICDDQGVPCDYRFLDINAAFERLTGLKRSEVVGKTLREALPGAGAEWVSLYGKVALTGEPIRLDRYSPELQRHYEIFSYRPAPRQFAVIFQNVTEKKQAEAELRKAQAKLQEHANDLEKTVARRTAKLRETIAELEHFSYALVHDMRAPLRAMQGFAELIQDESADREVGLSKEYLRRIKLAAVRMDQLITDSLSYSQAARRELTLEPVNLVELLKGLVETYPNLQPEQADIQIAKEIPAVLGNEAALTQCFSNLLGNAVKFAKPGTRPEIRVWGESMEKPPFAHAAARNPVAGGRWVRIWVEDNGIGIAKDSLARIFGIFQRATTSHEGTGIGLAIVRKVAQQMGGEVGVESREGEGSRFWVALAQAPQPPDASRRWIVSKNVAPE